MTLAFRIARTITIAAALAITVANVVLAAEARPWLCRDKPVFSSDRPMEYEVSGQSGRQWRIFFLQFTPGTAHDGFEIVTENGVPPHGDPATGRLAPGRYYAVAMDRQGEHWICPGYAHDDGAPKRGEVSNLCYAEDGPPCRVNLIVRPGDNRPRPPEPRAP